MLREGASAALCPVMTAIASGTRAEGSRAL